MKYIIVAYDRNRAIGARNTIPWLGKMKSDSNRLRELTTGSAIIMGRKTFESIARPLPNRQNIVISRQDISVVGITLVRSIQEAYAAVEPDKKTFIFGGSQIYQETLNDADIIYATEIETAIADADAFFPELGPEWYEVSREHHDADDDNIYPFDFVTYRKD